MYGRYAGAEIEEMTPKGRDRAIRAVNFWLEKQYPRDPGASFGEE
jgi:hypothetical protein